MLSREGHLGSRFGGQTGRLHQEAHLRGGSVSSSQQLRWLSRGPESCSGPRWPVEGGAGAGAQGMCHPRDLTARLVVIDSEQENYKESWLANEVSAPSWGI